jgi:hypothetical protein
LDGSERILDPVIELVDEELLALLGALALRDVEQDAEDPVGDAEGVHLDLGP